MKDLKQIRTINFRQKKYIFPAVLYVILMLLGYAIFDYMGQEEPAPVVKDYINSSLPTANVKEGLGNKKSNMKRVYGNATDLTKIDGIDEDTIRRKDSYESMYDEDEAREMAEHRAELDRLNELRKLEEEIARDSAARADVRRREFKTERSDSAIRAAQERRRQTMYDDLQKELGLINDQAEAKMEKVMKRDSLQTAAEGQVAGRGRSNGTGSGTYTGNGSRGRGDQSQYDEDDQRGVHALDEGSQSHDVVKVNTDVSTHFHTVSGNTNESSLIKAIVDEEVKAVDGTRVRLRLLDDIEIDGVKLPKGSYLYCTMSGFGSQRVKGKVESMLVGDELLRVSLSVYDCADGLEGLYVPASSFRETAKNIGGSALSGGSMSFNNGGYGSGNLASMGMQAVQQAYQQTTQAISKAIKKNKVRVKYGTQVYLVNTRQVSKKRK